MRCLRNHLPILIGTLLVALSGSNAAAQTPRDPERHGPLFAPPAVSSRRDAQGAPNHRVLLPQPRRLPAAGAGEKTLVSGVLSPRVQPRARRPRIGVVFGGGGAAGVCHVGVLKVLEEHGIPVDCIAGTSMGSIVAGLYATGMPASELEQIVYAFQWDKVLSEAPAHGRKYERRKGDDYLFPPAIQFGIQDGNVSLGNGFVSGQYLTLQLRRLLSSTHPIRDFDQLPIPFRTLATDVGTGEIVVFRGGSLATAIRASMSIPGVFPPVRVNNRLLVDGGLRNNVPTDLAREMGADILIVVELPTVFQESDDLKSMLAISGQSLAIVGAYGNSQHAEGLTPNDILIQPDMQGIGSLDFHRAREGVALGEAAAHQHDAWFAELARRLKSFDPNVGLETPVALGTPSSLRVDRIQINNRSPIASDASIASRLTVAPGQPFDLDQLDRDIARIYGTGNFGNVDYEIRVDELGRQVLDLNTFEDTRGATLATLGLGLEEDFSGDSFYTASIDIVSRGWNELGGESRLFGQLGSYQKLLLDFYQPINSSQTTFVRPYLQYDGYSQPFFQQHQKLAEFSLREYVGGIELGQTLGDYSVITAGVFSGRADSELLTGDPAFSNFLGGEGLGGVYAEVKTDTLDSYFLPKQGFLSEFRYTAFSRAFGHDDSSDHLLARLIAARTYGRHTFIIRGEAVYDDIFSGPTFRRQNAAGGFLRLSGFTKNAILASRRAQTSLVYLRHLREMAGKRINLYSGLSAEVGYFEGALNAANKRPIAAGSAFMALDTPLGPLFAGFGINDDNTSSTFIAMGQVF